MTRFAPDLSHEDFLFESVIRLWNDTSDRVG